MKGDYTHKQMVETLIVRVFPEMLEDLKLLIKKQPDRFDNVSHAARSAIIYALNQKHFLEYDGWYDKR